MGVQSGCLRTKEQSAIAGGITKCCESQNGQPGEARQHQHGGEHKNVGKGNQETDAEGHEKGHV